MLVQVRKQFSAYQEIMQKQKSKDLSTTKSEKVQRSAKTDEDQQTENVTNDDTRPLTQSQIPDVPDGFKFNEPPGYQVVGG
jgi:preprotein translocase subunit Sec63